MAFFAMAFFYNGVQCDGVFYEGVFLDSPKNPHVYIIFVFIVQLVILSRKIHAYS